MHKISTRLLALSFLASLLALAGCTEDSPSKRVTDVSDASGEDSTGPDDAADEDEDVDTPGRECSADEDCTFSGHRLGVCDTTTQRCISTCEDGFEDCDGDADNGCEVNLRADIENCGSCGNTCELTSLRLRPICDSTSDTAPPTCDVNPNECAEGYVNLDDEPGCECEITDPNDPIDIDGIDANCDGLDGIKTDLVFVATDGDDENDGTSPQAPLATLPKALEVAASQNRHSVLVAGGEYHGPVSLKDSINVYGGFKADGFARDTANEISKITVSIDDFDAETTDYITVKANTISGPTTLDTLTIEGADLSGGDATPSASSYAVWARASDGLALQNTTIVAGMGAPGADGAAGSTVACTIYTGGTPGGAGSSVSPCNEPSGTRSESGSDGRPDSSAGQGGLGGTQTCVEDRSQCAPDVVNGEDGAPGENGENGRIGEAPASGLGSLASGLWQPPTAAEPTAGERGTGGGGGGAGANCEDSACILCPDPIDTGGSGGKGGDGGCNGTAGENGQPGGASFGVLAASSDLSIIDTHINLGTGGDGGNGSLGGEGTPGTEANDGESGETDNGGTGGNGGRGGDGGAGGDGAGGCGGPAIGLAFLNSDIEQTTLTIDQAPGGAGAPGEGAGSADDGCAGVIAKTQDFATTD